MNKMKKGTILMSIGLLLLSAALCLTVYNIMDEKRAGKMADTVLSELQEKVQADSEEIDDTEELKDYQKYPEMEMPTKEVDGRYYIGILEIPVIGIELPVNDEWSNESARNAPCRYAGSVYSKDIVIAGHNYNTHFAKLEQLTYGDQIFFTDMEGNLFEYQVVEIEVLDGTDVEEMQMGDWDMTLFTCTYSGQTRLTIRCELTK